ncbi:Pre-mRNA-splicing factor like [Actinidia chinensis var. chinensis]|uniref:Pre-mRNA-splicing factor like n=1 Tax=Actinidia chinensis var. chinensis TaxID=1590841 RepID=A0A2R6RAE1_ACTCC|nr:Pre-mRNA-splicing factor like [Actinidia chinensis var. chinensis]
MDPAPRDSEVIVARVLINEAKLFPSHLQRFLNDSGGLIRLPSHMHKFGNSSSEDEDEDDDAFQLRKQPKPQAKCVFQIAVAPKLVWRNLHLLFANLDNPNDLETIYLAAVEIPNDPPQSEKIDVKIVARGPRELTTDVDVYDDHDRLPKYMQSDHDSQSGGNSNGQLPNISPGNSMMKSRNALLLIATVLATVTFQVPFHNLGRTSEDSSKAGTDGLRQSEFFTSRTFLFFNSIVFVASVVTSLFLLHEFPMKPLPQISISALFGSYMFSIKATSPNEAMPLLLISILFFLLAAAGKIYIY